MRTELYPQGLEIVTVSLEMRGPEFSRPYIEAAQPGHPSLLDPTHQMAALFGTVNIPNVIWIDEDGMIVRPAEPGWPNGATEIPATMRTSMPRTGRAPRAPKPPEVKADQRAVIGSGQDRAAYADRLRDWVAHGPRSPYSLSPEEVVDRSQARPIGVSAGAAHFELANRLWSDGRRDLAIPHFNECHRLQPENWTYKRQAWSLVGQERVGGEFGAWVQGPLEGEEADWPFDSDFRSDMTLLSEGQYYPDTFTA
ncbi:MAG: hypothetical protein Q7V88_01620 [Actinomycetota bacterium]|nr:hypothetical protein [Actinomycetota bacterium]